MGKRRQSMSTQLVGIVTKQFESQLAHYTSEKRGARGGHGTCLRVRRRRWPAPGSDSRTSWRQGGSRKCGAGRGICAAKGTSVDSVRADVDTRPGISSGDLRRDNRKAPPTPPRCRHLRRHEADQARAFAEIARITRPGGLVLLEDHVNPSALSCHHLYQTSRVAMLIGLRVPAFEIAPYAMVAFLTPAQLAGMAAKASGGALQIARQELLPVPMPIQWRLTLLRRNSGNLFLACQSQPCDRSSQPT